MKIVAIETIACTMPVLSRAAVPTLAGVARKSMEMLLVRITTDAGLIGWGEVFGLYNSWPAARIALDQLITPRFIGRNPLERNALTDMILRQLHPLGRNGAVMAAWSGVEMALWDIAGKAFNVPVSQLLGGAQVNTLRCYASLPRYGKAAPVVHDCEQAIERGYDAVKIHEITVNEIRAASVSLTGMNCPGLMVDANCPWSFDEAIQITRQLEGLDIKWLEEPLYPPDDYEGLARLRKECGIPIAAGEASSSMSDFDTMLRLDAVNFMQPSVAKIGGIGAMQRVHALTAGSAVEFAPHSPFLGPALVANMHLCAALAPATRMEAYFLDLVGNPFEELIRPRNGVLNVPAGPGLGCDPDPELLRKCMMV